MTTSTRRGARAGLRRGIGAALGLALVGALFTACAPPADSSGGSGGGEDGGTLTLGVVGNTKDQIYPYSAQSSPSQAVTRPQLYNGLTQLAPDGSVENVLAEKWDHNDDNTVWTAHLRPDVKLHSGATFGADDVIYSVKKILDPDAAYPPAVQIDMVDPDQVKKIDDLTVQFTLKKPYGPFPEAWATRRLYMIGKDWTEQNPDGTGPFTLDEWSPGRQAKFTRYDDYFGEKPGFEHLTVNYFDDESAITNALKGGQLDVAFSVPFTDIPSLKNTPGVKILASESAAYPMFEMRMDVEPFNDEKVREAFRLIVNREQIKDNAFGGYASIANDYLGNNTDCPVPDVPQRKQDIDKAKKLLKEAGKTNITIDLNTDGGYPGMMQMAQLFAQDAAKAGVTVNVKKLPGAAFLNKWREWPFLIGFSENPYLTIATQHFMPGGEENATHFDDSEYADILAKAYQSTDHDQQCKYVQQLQKIEYERGGDIVPVYAQTLTVYRDNVKGLQKDLYGRTSFLYGGVTVQ